MTYLSQFETTEEKLFKIFLKLVESWLKIR